MFYYKCKVIKSNTENGLLFIIKGLLSIIIDLLSIFTGLYAIIHISKISTDSELLY